MHTEPYKFPFNFERYCELRKKDLILIKNGQDLEKLEYDEFSDCSRQLVDYLCWEDKNKFLRLIENFLNSELDCLNFDSQFFNLIELISGIMIASQFYQNTLDDDEDGFTEEVYEEKVADLYQRYKKALVYDSGIDVEIKLDPLLLENSVNVEYKDNRVLEETMIFFTVVTGVVYTLNS